jgi:hypothetical protein
MYSEGGDNNNLYHSLYSILNFDWLIYLQLQANTVIVWAYAFVKNVA